MYCSTTWTVVDWVCGCGIADTERWPVAGGGDQCPLGLGCSRSSCICFTVIDLVGFRVCVLSSPLGIVVQGQFCFKTCLYLTCVLLVVTWRSVGSLPHRWEVLDICVCKSFVVIQTKTWDFLGHQLIQRWAAAWIPTPNMLPPGTSPNWEFKWLTRCWFSQSCILKISCASI